MTQDSRATEERTKRVLLLLNSRGVAFETGIDSLASREAAMRYLGQEFGQPVSLSSKSLVELRALRDALFGTMGATVVTSPPIEVLNQLAESSRFRLQFSDRDAVYVPVNPRSVLETVLVDVASLFNAGLWDRFKNCANASCAATFYDKSRNKTQRWHSFEVCGNKQNVAAHRARMASH